MKNTTFDFNAGDRVKVVDWPSDELENGYIKGGAGVKIGDVGVVCPKNKFKQNLPYVRVLFEFEKELPAKKSAHLEENVYKLVASEVAATRKVVVDILFLPSEIEKVDGTSTAKVEDKETETVA